MSESSIQAEIAGSIWKITKAVGDKVAEGEALMIMESMKMEIPVLAPEGGIIKQILVTEGEAIQQGALLAILDV